MHTLEPGERFGIVRQLPDPNDSSTYYVRAFVRNARTGALLATLDLEDDGDGRFLYDWPVYAAITEGGFYINIATYVYTESTYTTYSTDHRVESQTYLIETRARHLGGGGGGGSSIDYKKIREIVREIFEEKFKLPKDKKDKDLSPLFRMVIKAVERALVSTERSILAEVKTVGTAVGGIEVDPQVNLSEILEAIKSLESDRTAEEVKAKELMDDMERLLVALPASLIQAGEAMHAKLEAAMEKRTSRDGEVEKLQGFVKSISDELPKLLEGYQAPKEKKVEEEPMLSPYEIIKSIAKEKK